MNRDMGSENMAGKIGVLHIITGLTTGGAERALYNLLNGGLAERFNSHVISLSDDGTMGSHIRALGVSVTSLGMRGGRPSFYGLVKMRRVVREFQPDLIQGWMYHGNLVAALARSIAAGHPPLVWNVRQSLYDIGNEKFITRLVVKLNKFFSSSPDVIINNSYLSQKQHESFGFVSQSGLVIPNGIDVQRFCFSAEARKHIRTELGIPVEAQVVGHVARLHPMKDHPAFLRAAVSIALRYPTLHFLLSGRDVLLENKILEPLVPAWVRDRFHLLGERGDVSELMCAMDVFCVSSAWGEGFPNVIGEAMAVGVPCVATDVGDSAIVIGDTGAVAPLRDEKALSAAISKLLMMSSEERYALGTSARVRIEKKYTLETIVKKYAALYEKLIQEREDS